MTYAPSLQLRAQAEQERRRRARTAEVKPPPLDAWIGGEVTIEEPQGEAVSIIPFALWPKQREALDVIKNQAQVIILKARQLGMSWLVIAYAIWLCIYHANKLVMVFSKDQDSANEMIRRAKGIYQRLTNKPTALTTDNVAEIGWSNGSRIKAFAATKHAGSSFTASLTILDEFAKMDYAESLYTAVKPTIADGGKMIIISTGNGEENPFHRLWQAAVKRVNRFYALFLDWRARPDRTAEWYAAQEADAISSAHHRQEYPATPEEAFVSLGEDRFLSSMILWDSCREDLPPLGPYEQLLLAYDDAEVSDSFGLLGVTAHPTKPNVLAVRLVYEWTPPQGTGIIDHYGTAENPGPDWVIRNTIAKKYALVQAVYDPHDRQIALGLMNDGVVACVPFGQTDERLESDKFLFDLIASRRIVHDGNQALRKHIDNANRKPDPNGKRLRIVKRNAALKIDLTVCLSMAAYAAYKIGMIQ